MPITQISLRTITNDQTLATIYMVILCVQIVAIEGYGVSPVKVTLMAFSTLVFIIRVPYITKALVFGALFWAVCYFVSLFNGDMRFSTIGYLGMFVISFIVFYNLLYAGALSLSYFSNLLRCLILAFCIILVLQQICLVLNIRSFWPINLDNQFFLSLTKLPSLTIEPSHSARILSALMLGYLRCWELENDGVKMKLGDLLAKKNRSIIFLFLWSMLTMGSGTAFVGLALISIYFIEWKTIIYILPLFVGLFLGGQTLKLEQMDRAVRVAQAAATGNSKNVIEEDGSAAYRVIPIINTLKMDLSKKESWVGHGTTKKNEMMSLAGDRKINVIEQFGLLGFFASLLLIFGCVIRRFLSLESLFFLLLLGFSLGNIYYTWAVIMIFAGVRYFQDDVSKGRVLTFN